MDRKQTKLVTLILLASGLVLIGLVAGFYFFGSAFWTYRHPAQRFTIKYPARWEVKPDFGGASVVFVAPLAGELDYFQESVNVVVQDLSARPMSLLDYSSTALNQMRAVFGPNIEEIESSPATLSGLPAHRYVFIGKGPDLELKYHIVWAIKNSRAYQVTFSGIASQARLYERDFARMLQSFRVP